MKHAAESGEVRGTAEKFKIWPFKIRWHRPKFSKFKKKPSFALSRDQSTLVHSSPPVHFPGAEAQLLNWVMAQRENTLAVYTQSIICRALAVQPDFKKRDPIELENWVFEFMRRNTLVVRSSAHVGQRVPGDTGVVKSRLSRSAMTVFHQSDKNPKCFVSMDETALWFDF